jgi:hypothetical protein
MRVLLPAITVLLASAACAPVTMAPMAIRMGPSDMKNINAAFGLRAGPRLSASVSGPPPGGGIGTVFRGDNETFNIAQWAPAYDMFLSKGLTETTAIHIGAQGEVYYPFPLPAYGLYAGVSQYHRFGRLGIGPTLTARGATDFGIGLVGGPGTILGGEAACSIGVADDKLPFALIPFYGFHGVFARSTVTPSHYAGGVVALQAHFRSIFFEVTAGFGRVLQPGQKSWNAPIIGIRVGH